MRIYYVFNARVPNRKAYGIQLAKMCEAFIEQGVDLTLVIPKSRALRVSLREFYQLRVDVPTVILPALDWYDRGRVLFFLSSLVFMVSSLLYLVREKWRGRLGIVYTIDMDRFSFALLPLAGAPVFCEVHDARNPGPQYRYFFKRLRGVIAINTEVKRYLMEMFHIPAERILPAENAVDALWLACDISQRDARRALALPADTKIAMYAGRFYNWKGLDVLPAACEKMPDVECYVVGGSIDEFKRESGISRIPSNMHIIPPCKNDEVPYWLAAADVLIVLTTKKNEIAYRYLSPMKTYEYMAMRRPVVASDAPALRAIVNEGEVLFYEPDNADDLAAKIRTAIAGGQAIEKMVARAFEAVQTKTWDARAKHILGFIEERIA